MNSAFPSPILLLGVGGSGCSIVRKVKRAYGENIRALAVDTDAYSIDHDEIPFVLLGGNRLSGRGTGGQPSSARAAFQDNNAILDPYLEGVATVVVVAGLGSGTGTGATGEILKRLHTLGITTLLFATLPFSFEGDEREQTAKSSCGPLEQYADVSVFLPLDSLVGDSEAQMATLENALATAVETMSSGITLLWNLVEKPGYINISPEHLRQILVNGGRARFATARAFGSERAAEVLKVVSENSLLKRGNESRKIKNILIGILAGKDLLLSEVGEIASSISAAFAPEANRFIGTVQDDERFAGELSIVVMLFEEKIMSDAKMSQTSRRAFGNVSRFNDVDKTIWNGENLDQPTYLRRQLTLDR